MKSSASRRFRDFFQPFKFLSTPQPPKTAGPKMRSEIPDDAS